MPAGLVSNTPSCCELKRKAVFVYKLTFHSGDSYTTPGFNDTGVQPSIGNPLGNPNYPGYTSSNGPNWVDFLTVKYNESQVLTCNLAYGGATFESALAAPNLPTVLSVA